MDISIFVNSCRAFLWLCNSSKSIFTSFKKSTKLTKIEISNKDKDIQNERIKEFYTNLPKFEYKVLKFRDRMMIGDTKTKPMEEMLNAFARQGWKVISMVENTWRQEGIMTGNSHGEILVTMERQVFNG
ncbi:DUF4177 domain-containing protein [Lactococcus lactis]